MTPAIRYARRPGIATGEAILLTISVLTLSGIGLAILPGMIRAGERAPAALIDEPPAGSSHRATYEGLRTLLGSSRAMLATWGTAPGADRTPAHIDLLLWICDDTDPATINESEVLLLSYSPITNAITAFAPATSASDELLAEINGAPGTDKPFPIEAVRDPAFPQRWRTRSGVRGTVIAANVANMRIERAPEPAGYERLMIALTWGENRADDSLPEARFEVRLPVVQGLH